jgi:hypothetical protein
MRKENMPLNNVEATRFKKPEKGNLVELHGRFRDHDVNLVIGEGEELVRITSDMIVKRHDIFITPEAVTKGIQKIREFGNRPDVIAEVGEFNKDLDVILGNIKESRKRREEQKRTREEEFTRSVVGKLWKSIFG